MIGKLIQDAVTEYSYDAKLAGLSCETFMKVDTRD